MAVATKSTTKTLAVSLTVAASSQKVLRIQLNMFANFYCFVRNVKWPNDFIEAKPMRSHIWVWKRVSFRWRVRLMPKLTDRTRRPRGDKSPMVFLFSVPRFRFCADNEFSVYSFVVVSAILMKINHFSFVFFLFRNTLANCQWWEIVWPNVRKKVITYIPYLIELWCPFWRPFYRIIRVQKNAIFCTRPSRPVCVLACHIVSSHFILCPKPQPICHLLSFAHDLWWYVRWTITQLICS